MKKQMLPLDLSVYKNWVFGVRNRLMHDNAFQGSLFSSDFLQESITRLPDWAGLSDQDIADLASDLRQIFNRFPVTQTPNESQTEDDLIWPILQRLGWGSSLRQQNLAPRGRDDVPDGLLFKDEATKTQANGFPSLCPGKSRIVARSTSKKFSDTDRAPW